MIAHVAETGENRGRVVLQLGSAHPSVIALEAAVRIARAFQSEIESVFVEDEQLFDCAAYGFVREVSLSGRQSRTVSADAMTKGLRKGLTSYGDAGSDTVGNLARAVGGITLPHLQGLGPVDADRYALDLCHQ